MGWECDMCTGIKKTEERQNTVLTIKSIENSKLYEKTNTLLNHIET